MGNRSDFPGLIALAGHLDPHMYAEVSVSAYKGAFCANANTNPEYKIVPFDPYVIDRENMWYSELNGLYNLGSMLEPINVPMIQLMMHAEMFLAALAPKAWKDATYKIDHIDQSEISRRSSFFSYTTTMMESYLGEVLSATTRFDIELRKLFGYDEESEETEKVARDKLRDAYLNLMKEYLTVNNCQMAPAKVKFKNVLETYIKSEIWKPNDT